MPDVVAGGERVEVAYHLIGFAYVAAQDLDQVEIDLALLRELHDRDLNSFLEDRLAVGPKASSADVHHMCGAREKAYKFVAEEGRRDHGNVVKMPGPLPGIVGDVGVACVHLLAR